MRFIKPDPEELELLRPDPLLWEQELDARPELAEALEKALGLRSGKTYWRSDHDYLYALELADLGKGRPSMATLYGYWDRWEPRPPEHEINQDILAFLLWVAEFSEGVDAVTVEKLARHRDMPKILDWPDGSVLRTPEERFANLPDFPYEPKYLEIEGLRMAYVEAGSGDPIWMQHGEPTWGFLYRHLIPILVEAGRVIVPDLIGFGRSDKPIQVNCYSFKSHVRWMRKFIEILDLKNITLVCQDWGGTIGLRVLSERPERFKRLVAMNTGITPGVKSHKAFSDWLRSSQAMKEMPVDQMMRRAVNRPLTDAEAAAYQAPFPSKEYQTCALLFPRLVPIRPDQPGSYDNRLAIERLKTLDLPVKLIWGEKDEVTKPNGPYLARVFKNAGPLEMIKNAGHMIQEDAGEKVGKQILEWIRTTS
ncbi:MAG: alpha/beta fold hydrolase [Deltaproteobacteria bacterium]|nr:alpha/beta fold hydrolase [Deltaproteobacteria bacterium]